jgi:lipid-A-disaccharide synthase
LNAPEEISAAELLIVAGEPSGDLHGSLLLKELSSQVPGLSTYGLGSDRMQAAGCKLLADSREIAVVGLTEALRILPRAFEILRMLLDEVDRRGTRIAVLVDFPEFNLRLAKQLHRRGVRVIYYISPQIWAWRRRRVEQIRRTVDSMLVLFPFEVDFYREHGVEVHHVGHPLVDEVPILKQVWESPTDAAEIRVLALLPGSRRSEVRALLPPMLETAKLLARDQALKVQLIEAPSVDPELFERILHAAGLDVVRVREKHFQAIAASHLALCASGTATLEVGLLGTPMVVLYRLSAMSHFLARMLVRLSHFAMVNLVLGRGAVPELIQPVPERVAELARPLLAGGTEVEEMRMALHELRMRLGKTGASRRAAAVVAQVAGWKVSHESS